MSESTIATITGITLNQTVDINGTLEPCHFIEFDSTLSDKVIPGDSTGSPAARMFFPQLGSGESRATVPPVDLISGFGSAPEIMEINRTGAAVNGVPAWGIAIARWTNTPSPAISVGDEVIFVGNTNSTPNQSLVITGCTNAQIQSAIVDYRKYTTAGLYDIWLNTRSPNFSANIVFSGDNTFSGQNTFSDINTFSNDNIFSGDNTFSGQNTFSNINTFTGANDFTGADQTFNNIVVTSINSREGILTTDYKNWNIEYGSTTTIIIKAGSRFRSADDTVDIVFGSDYTIDITDTTPDSSQGGLSVARATSTQYSVYVGLDSSGDPLAWGDTSDLSSGGTPTNPAAYSTGRVQVLGQSNNIPFIFYLNATGSGEVEPFVVNNGIYVYASRQTIVSGGTSTSIAAVAPSGRIPALCREVLVAVSINATSTRNADVITYRNVGGGGAAYSGLIFGATAIGTGYSTLTGKAFLREIENAANGFYYQISYISGTGTPSVNLGYWGYVL